MNDLKRDDPIDEHEMEKIIEATEKAHEILSEIPFREFSVKITEL
jgi:hypothetical protein